jgi:hypothetical protein
MKYDILESRKYYDDMMRISIQKTSTYYKLLRRKMNWFIDQHKNQMYKMNNIS